MGLPESITTRIKVALEPATKLIGTHSANLAKFTLIDHGVPIENMSLADVMVVGARAWIGSLAGQGLFDYVPLEEEFSLAAEQHAKACRDPADAAMAKKVGLLYDATLVILHNFTPLYQMIYSALVANGKEVTFPPVLELRPCSIGASRWAGEIGSPLRYVTPTLPVSQEELKPLADTIAVEAINEKLLITEESAAELLSCSPKSLGNRRRADEINRSTYIQTKPGGKILYRKAALIAAASNGTVFATPKSGKKK
jgi:hypothetical protein